MSKMEELREISKNNNGILQTSIVLKNGISKPVLAKFVEQYGYERISHGIYCSPDVWEDRMFLLQLRFKKTVYSHETALYLLDMTDQEPHSYTMTVSSGYNASSLKNENIKVYSIKKELLELGSMKVKTPFNNEVVIYNPERTICDLIRSRSNIEIQVFQDAMKAYVKRRDKNLHLLMEYAEKLRVSKVLKKYLEVLL